MSTALEPTASTTALTADQASMPSAWMPTFTSIRSS